MKNFKSYLTEAAKSPNWYKGLYKHQKGIFYRGEDPKTRKSGAGLGALGTGIYLTWERDTALAYANLSRAGTMAGVVVEFKVPANLKLADSKGEDFLSVLEKMGITGYSADPMFAKALTFELKKMGYDGVVSDDKIEGLVIFEPRKVKKIK